MLIFLFPARRDRPVHAAMDRLPVLVRARPPGVVPQSAPVALLLIADQVRDHPAFSLQLGEPAEDREAAGTSSNDANLTNHFWSGETQSDFIKLRNSF